MLSVLSSNRSVQRLFSLSAITGVLKLSSALATFFLTFMVTNAIGAESTGQFFYIYNLAFLLAMFSLMGFNISLLKFNTLAYKEGDKEKLRSLYSFSFIRVLTFSLVLSAGIYLFSEQISGLLASAKISPQMLNVVALILPFLVLSLLHAACLQSLSRVISSIFSMQLGLCALLIITVGAFHKYGQLDVETLLKYLVIFVLSISLFAAIKWMAFSKVTPQLSFRIAEPELKQSARKLWVSNSITNMTQWGGLVIAGFFVSAHDLGILSAAQRASLLIGFVLITINFVVAPVFSSLYKEKKTDQLIRVSKLIFRTSLAIGIVPTLVFGLFPEWVMGWFGTEFVSGASLLVVLTLGQLVNISTGSVGYLLIMSGHENEFKNISIISGIINLVCLVLFSILFGAIGAAAAITLSMMITNFLALMATKKHLGFYPIG